MEGRNTAGMDDWASHTISDLTKHEINAGHYEIFNSENHAQVVSLIRNTFTHHETVQKYQNLINYLIGLCRLNKSGHAGK